MLSTSSQDISQKLSCIRRCPPATSAKQLVRMPQAHGKGGARVVRDYELMYIARPDLDDEGLQAAADSVEQLVTAAGGTVVHTTNWGRRRLAYEVDHLRDGNYMLLHVRLDGQRVRDVERALSIHETVFRHLLVVREGGDDAEPDAIDGVAPDAAAAVDATPARQAVVAVDEDDAGGDEQAEDDDDEDDDDEPAALVATTEEEN
jgi:small subunit ribosomal protein S6